MEISGRIIFASEPREGVSKASGNPWKTQEFVLETAEQYPKKMMFSVFGEDKLKQFNLNVGDEVTVSFDVNAREYNGRWYNDIRAWRVERSSDAPAVQAAPAAASAPDEFGPSNDDLPF